MSLVIQRRLSFVALVWSCFWHVLRCSSLLWVVTGCSTFYKGRSYKMSWLDYKSTSTNECKSCYKRDSFFELQSGASGRKQILISTLIETDLIHYLQMRTCTSEIFVKVFSIYNKKDWKNFTGCLSMCLFTKRKQLPGKQLHVQGQQYKN